MSFKNHIISKASEKVQQGQKALAAEAEKKKAAEAKKKAEAAKKKKEAAKKKESDSK